MKLMRNIKGSTLATVLCAVVFCGCLVQKTDVDPAPTPGPDNYSQVSQTAEYSMRVYAQLMADGVDDIDWSSERSAGESIKALREKSRIAAFRPLNEIMATEPFDGVGDDAEWNPDKAEDIGEAIKKGYERVAE